MQNIIQLNKELLHIIKIPDVLYTVPTLKKALLKKLNKKKTIVEYYISIELQTFLNEPNNYIGMENLINTIIMNYSQNLNRPNYDYYSYDQKPNYDLL
jgi:hypothetical protein